MQQLHPCSAQRISILTVSSLHENLFIGYVVLVLMPIVATLMTRFFLIEESDMFHTENTQVINFVLSLLVYDHEQSIQTKVSPGADGHHLLTHLQDVYVFDSFRKCCNCTLKYRNLSIQ